MVTQRMRDAHDMKELAYMLNSQFNLANRLRLIADDIENNAKTMQIKMESVARDLLGIENGKSKG